MLKNLRDETLLSDLKELVFKERQAVIAVIDHLREVEARQLFAKYGYSSLFQFCMDELGYTKAESYVRIAAMRSIRDLPLARQKLDQGSVSMSTLSQLYTFTRHEEKVTATKLTTPQRAELLNLIENKSQSQCEGEFIKLRPNWIQKKQSTRVLTEEFTEIKFIASQELMGLLGELNDLLGHKNIDGHAELITEIAMIAREKLVRTKPARTVQTGKKSELMRKIKAASKTRKSKTLGRRIVKIGSPSKPISRSRYIPQKLRRKIWIRDQGRCQYVCEKTGRPCESRYALQVDHAVPFAKGGMTEEKNLRLLCRTHNQNHAVETYGREQMLKFIPSLKS